MKPIAIFVLVAAFSLVTVAASAKNVTTTQSDSERVTNTVAGPPPTPKPKVASTAQPDKATLKKSKVKPKPPLTDPN